MSLKSSLITERLTLRCITDADYDIMRHLDVDPVVKKYLGPAVDESETQKRMDKIHRTNTNGQGLGYWMGEITETQEAIGWFVLNHIQEEPLIEIGYRLLEKHWGVGFATEGSRVLLDYGFNTLKLPQIVGLTAPDHLASQKILLKIGLVQKENRFLYNQDVCFFEKYLADSDS